MKCGLMFLYIFLYVRDYKSSWRFSEFVVVDDFGNFIFKNLFVFEKVNKDVIQKLCVEVFVGLNKFISFGGVSNNSIIFIGIGFEGSFIIVNLVQWMLFNVKVI